MSKLFNSNFSKSDDFYTHEWAIDLLLKHADLDEYFVYEPACGEGHIIKRLRECGVSCRGNDIKTGHDFLRADNNYIRSNFSAIVTNPPFSIKDAFIEKCVEIGLPWALLLPVVAMQSKRRNVIFSKLTDLTIIIPNRRIAFIGADRSLSFASAWFCSGFGMSKQLIFQETDE